MRRGALLGVALAVVAVACAPDPLDTYSAPDADADAPPATLAPLPTTTTIAAASASELVPASFPPNGQTVDIRSLDNSFIQQELQVEAGTEVNWINGGRNDHDVLPVDESLSWGVDRDTFVPGTEYSHVFDTPGVYPYYCSIHGTSEAGMVGAIIVTEPA